MKKLIPLLLLFSCSLICMGQDLIIAGRNYYRHDADLNLIGAEIRNFEVYKNKAILYDRKIYHEIKDQIMWLSDSTFKIMPKRQNCSIANLGDTVKEIMSINCPCGFLEQLMEMNKYYFTLNFTILYDHNWAIVTRKERKPILY